jgi:dCMP deaminase
VTDRPDWDTYFITMARSAALRGDCRRLQVGAVLVWDNRIWASGYNGTMNSGQEGCLAGKCPRGLKSFEEAPHYFDGNQDFSDCIAVHAEINALKQWQKFDMIIRPMGAPRPVMYVSARPCRDCAAILVGNGVESKWPKSSV